MKNGNKRKITIKRKNKVLTFLPTQKHAFFLRACNPKRNLIKVYIIYVLHHSILCTFLHCTILKGFVVTILLFAQGEV